MRIHLYSLILCLITAVLSACDGGGGGSAPVDTTIDLTVSEATILPEGSVQLIPVFPATSTATIDNDVGTVTSKEPVTVNPSSTTTYTLTVTHSNGDVATASVTVTVLALASLEIVAENLDQVFQPQLNSYTASTGYLARSARVRATTDVTDAVITVNSVAVDQDGYSHLVTLTEGGTTNFNTVITLGDVSNTYTIAVTRSDFASLAEEAYIKASNTGDNDEFGYSVDISGDTLVVGAYLEDADDSGSFNDSGAVYVFVRSGSTWEQQAYLQASNFQGGDNFGTSVAISGDTIVVGVPFEDSDTTGVNSTPSEDALQAGATYVFTRTGGIWSQQAYLKASNSQSSDNFGHSVAIDGNTIVIGAIGEDSSVPGVNQTPVDDISTSSSGAVYVFVRDADSNWSQQAYIKASNPGQLDRFGNSVSVYGDTLAVGARLEDSDTTGINSTPNDPGVNEDSGAAYVFVRSDNTWSEQAYIKASNNAASMRFGHSVSVDGDSLAVGAYVESTTENASGAAYVFTRSGDTWSEQQSIKASNIGKSDNFGYSVAISGDTLVVGAILEDSITTGVNSTPDDTPNENRGAAYIFTRSNDAWSENAYIKASNSGGDDEFGASVAVSGDTVAVSANLEDGSATGIDGSDDDASTNSGAVYVYE